LSMRSCSCVFPRDRRGARGSLEPVGRPAPSGAAALCCARGSTRRQAPGASAERPASTLGGWRGVAAAAALSYSEAAFTTAPPVRVADHRTCASEH
jgi:hypothetical protein